MARASARTLDDRADTAELRAILLSPDKLTWMARARSADDLAALDEALARSDAQEDVVLAVAPMWPGERRRLLATLDARGLRTRPVDMEVHARAAACAEREHLPAAARPIATLIGAARVPVRATRDLLGRSEQFVQVTDPDTPVGGCAVRLRPTARERVGDQPLSPPA